MKLSITNRHRHHLSVAIIGAGFSGIAAAIEARRAGVDTLTIYERSTSVGGTWWDNQYPGAEVDTPSVLYSFSYAPWNWTRTHVRQAELQEYMEATVDAYGLRPHLRMGTAVKRVEWIEERQHYEVTLADGRVENHSVVISAVGLLNVPRFPDWPGMASFAGPKLHTSQWLGGLDLADKTIAVVGSGSTAAQLVPSLAESAGSVVMFQREPGWILPKGDRAFTMEERDALKNPTAQRVVRMQMLLRRERAQYKNAAWRPGTPQNTAAEAAARRYIASVFAECPEMADAVTPKYPFGGKRPILTDDFYPALLRDNVTLVPRAVQSLTEDAVVDADGVHHRADVLVMSTGFMADFIPTFDVIGRQGQKLTDLWAGEPQAFLGILVPQMPNFFMMYGPNTNGGAIVSHIEAQAKYIASALKHMRRTSSTALEVKPAAHRVFNNVLQRRLAGASFESANNYYKSATGRVITQWSDGAIAYTAVTRLLRQIAWKTESSVGRSTQPR